MPDVRKRRPHEGKRGRPVGQRKFVHLDFQNPWPYMSDIEAMVKLQLDGFGVPYSWRLFDAWEQAPTLKLIAPDYAPEFTLREYKAVIVVIGGFFGTIPGVLDRTALAQAALENDGWKVALLLENDIRKNPYWAVKQALPELTFMGIRGAERPNPLAVALLGAQMARRRQQLRALALHKKLFRTEFRTGTNRRRKSGIYPARRRRARRGRGAVTRDPQLRKPLSYGG